MLTKLTNYHPRYSLVSLYEVLMRSHLDYADINNDEPDNMNI